MLRTILLLVASLILANCEPLLSDRSLLSSSISITQVTLTAYSPSPHITSGDPFATASGMKIEPRELDAMRYVAISQDLIQKFKIKYGDVIFIGFQVQDTMNPRIKNTVDLFLRNLALARKFGKQERNLIIVQQQAP